MDDISTSLSRNCHEKRVFCSAPRCGAEEPFRRASLAQGPERSRRAEHRSALQIWVAGEARVRTFGDSNFEFVSDFDIRISDFHSKSLSNRG